MASTLLVADAALTTITALLYAYVGLITLRRATSDDDGRRAVRLFAIWWLGLAALTVAGVVRIALYVAGVTDLTTHLLITNASVLLLVAVLWGLVSYLAYIYLGTRRVFLPVTLFHVALLGFLAYVVLSREATGVTLTATGARIDYATEFSKGVSITLILGIILPAFIAAVGYATLYFRTADRTARYRIAMVSGAFLLWFGSAGVAGILELGKLEYWPIVSRVIGLVATLMVLAAYKPPRMVQEAFGIQPVEMRHEDASETKPRAARPTVARAVA